ncbi:MAG: AraC family transcriptional regulator [Victivallaceae bacterium]|nr:AraC family transcriptional regulator [Victivallaceae bacterium]
MYCYHLAEYEIDHRHFAFMAQQMPRGRSERIHAHDCYEFMCIRNGYGINTVAAMNHPIIAGDVYVIPPAISHRFFAASDLEFYTLMVDADFFRMEFTPSLFGPEPVKLRLSTVEFEKMDAFCREMVEESKQREPNYPAAMNAWMNLLLTQLGRIHLRGGASKVSPEVRAHPMTENYLTLSGIIDFVNRNYLHDINLAMIAEKQHLSEKYLSRFFRRETGTPLIRYINNLRVEKARRLLMEHREWNITEIASRCGFCDASYFTRVFRRTLHLSPSDFRRNTD